MTHKIQITPAEENSLMQLALGGGVWGAEIYAQVQSVVGDRWPTAIQPSDHLRFEVANDGRPPGQNPQTYERRHIPFTVIYNPD